MSAESSPAPRPPRPPDSTIPPSPRRIAVLIPARDEEGSLPHLLAALVEANEARGPVRFDPIVVADNGSTDRTSEMAEAGGAVVVRESQLGYGSACLAGIRWLASLGRPPTGVLFVDADQAHPPGLLESIAEPVLEGEAELVLGVRRTGAGPQATMPAHQRLGNRIVLGLVRGAFGWRLPDLPPLRAISWAALGRLEMDDRDWGWTLQMQLRARSLGLRTVERPVPHRGRTRGESKISGSLGTSLRVGWKMFRTIARERGLHRARSRPAHGSDSS